MAVGKKNIYGAPKRKTAGKKGPMKRKERHKRRNCAKTHQTQFLFANRKTIIVRR